MIWERSETLALAKVSCAKCHGTGLRSRRGQPCNCVLRAIFRACYARFRFCVNQEKYLSKVSVFPCLGLDRKRSYGRLIEEYIADFCLVGKRHLGPAEYPVFRCYFLLGADWRLCCRQLNLERGQFFHLIYRIQRKLGRVFRELEPYSLYPIDEYFGGRIERAVSVVPLRNGGPGKTPVRPPLQKLA